MNRNIWQVVTMNMSEIFNIPLDEDVEQLRFRIIVLQLLEKKYTHLYTKFTRRYIDAENVG